MPLRFTFRQLEYLVAVGDAGTIAQAAQRLNVSSPSISAAISQLEDEFGVQLFVRHHAQGLSLTPGGQRVFNAAKDILGQAAGLNDLASDITHLPRGPISIGVFTTVAPLLSAAIRRSFNDAFPEASVTLREGNQVELLRMLGRAEIDVALTYDLEIPKDIAFEPLASLPPYVMLPQGHPLTKRKAVSLQELEHERMILLDLPLSRDYFLSLFQSQNLRPNIAERTMQMSVLRSLVANGFGFGLVNMLSGSRRAPDGQPLVHVPLLGTLRPMALGLATKQAARRPAIVNAFYAHMRDEITITQLSDPR